MPATCATTSSGRLRRSRQPGRLLCRCVEEAIKPAGYDHIPDTRLPCPRIRRLITMLRNRVPTSTGCHRPSCHNDLELAWRFLPRRHRAPVECTINGWSRPAIRPGKVVRAAEDAPRSLPTAPASASHHQASRWLDSPASGAATIFVRANASRMSPAFTRRHVRCRTTSLTPESSLMRRRWSWAASAVTPSRQAQELGSSSRTMLTIAFRRYKDWRTRRRHLARAIGPSSTTVAVEQHIRFVCGKSSQGRRAARRPRAGIDAVLQRQSRRHGRLACFNAQRTVSHDAKLQLFQVMP